MVTVEKQWLDDLRSCAEELAEDLESELGARYLRDGEIKHPAEQRRYDRDMRVVRRLRNLLDPA